MENNVAIWALLFQRSKWKEGWCLKFRKNYWTIGDCTFVRFFKKCDSTFIAKKRKYSFWRITAVIRTFGKSSLQHWIFNRLHTLEHLSNWQFLKPKIIFSFPNQKITQNLKKIMENFLRGILINKVRLKGFKTIH